MTYKKPADKQIIKGRGAISQRDSRYNQQHREQFDDGWHQYSEQIECSQATQVSFETPKTIISRNQSPDVPFEQSINPYRGCEHGCIYCFARPSHAYLDLSPGLDFETKLTAKRHAAHILRKQLLAPNYQCKPIALGANTDPYQPIERRYHITRDILLVLQEFNHPCIITTKSALVERDLDLISAMADKNLIHVNLSFTTLDPTLSRYLEPRASSPKRRLQTIATLKQANIPVNILLAPVIPVLTDPEMETILQAVSESGADSANYILLRLPLELVDLFAEWLHHHYPDKARHVLQQIQQTRQGKYNDSSFEHRASGKGVMAEIIHQRFNLASKKANLSQPLPALNSDLFQPHPVKIDLFWRQTAK